MSTFTPTDYDNAYNEYCRHDKSFPKDRCGEVLKNILYSDVATYTEMDLGISVPEFQNSEFFNCLKGIIGKGFHETVDTNDKLHIKTLTSELFKHSTTYQTMYDLYNGFFSQGVAGGYYVGWFSSPLVQTAYFMLQARETRLGKYPQQQRAEKLRKLRKLQELYPQYPPFTSTADRISKWWELHDYNMELAQQLYGADLDDLVRKGGSRRRKTVHRKRKSHRKSKSKRVRQTRRKQSRRHRHSRHRRR
jgi:hypothetical protein